MSKKARRDATADPPTFQLLNEVGIIDQLAQHRAGQLLAPELNMPKFIVLNHLVRRGSNATQHHQRIHIIINTSASALPRQRPRITIRIKS